MAFMENASKIKWQTVQINKQLRYMKDYLKDLKSCLAHSKYYVSLSYLGSSDL